MSNLRINLIVGLLLFPIVVQASSGGHEEGLPAHLISDYGNFLILFLGIFYAVKKPMKNLFKSRSLEIKDQIEEAHSVHSQAKASYEEYDKKTKALETQLKSIVDDYKKLALLEKENILSESQAQRERILVESDRVIAQEAVQLKEKIKKDILEVSTAKTRSLLSENLQDEDQNRIVSDCLVQLKKVTA